MSGSRNRKEQKKKGSLSTALPTSDLEQDTSNGYMAEEKITPFNTPVSIHVHSKRKREVDIDGISAKAIIDGIVTAGLLEDDSPKYVKEVTFSQEKSKEEETIVYIEEHINE